MAKVIRITKKMVKFKEEYTEAKKHYFLLKPNMQIDEIKLIINWCNENCLDYVFVDYENMRELNDLETGLNYMSRNYKVTNKQYIKRMQEINDRIHKIAIRGPKFKFIEIADMMLFKLQWSDLIVKTRND